MIATTIKQAMEQASGLQEVSESWKLDCELLLADALACSREHLYTWPEQALDSDQLAAWQNSMARRGRGEPIAYILGRKAFWDFELQVNEHVLIPRPETELLVERAIEILEKRSEHAAQPNMAIADLGCGSGAIAIALARQNPAWQLTAVDISAAALAVARENARSLQQTNIEFCLGSWCDGLGLQQFDLIAANPPYVAQDDEHLSQGDLPFEPIGALTAKSNGLADIESIIAQAQHCLKNGGSLLVEHGYNQKAEVMALFESAGFVDVSCTKDYAGTDRMTQGRLSG